MPTFILAGVQRSLVKRVQKAVESNSLAFPGWVPKIFAGSKNAQHDISSSQVDDLLRLAAASDGAHIFGLSTSKLRSEVDELIKPHFRFRWMDARIVGPIGGGNEVPLIDGIKDVLAEESLWNSRVRPQEFGSPLVLPEIFGCDRFMCQIWRLSQSYNNIGHLHAAIERVANFAPKYRKRISENSKTAWVADDDWIWDDNGTRHGKPSFPLDWKFSFKLPDGFHFDVSPRGKGKTHFQDKDGKRHTFNKHLNVTAHGNIRGA